MHWSISLKFSTEFQHVTANTFVQGQRVKGQGPSVCNRQRRLTAKSVRICCLFNVEKGRGATWCAFVVARRNFPKRNIFEQKTQKMLIICQIDWREVGVAFELQCLRNCTLSSCECNGFSQTDIAVCFCLLLWRFVLAITKTTTNAFGVWREQSHVCIIRRYLWLYYSLLHLKLRITLQNGLVTLLVFYL